MEEKKTIKIVVKPIVIMPRGFWHIRKYFKSGHDTLIVGESGNVV